MKIIDMEYLCTVIGNLSGVPIRLYRGDEQIFYYSIAQLPKDPMSVYKDQIWAVTDHVGYFVTNHFHYYGIVNSTNLRFIIGPTRQVMGNDQELRELGLRADVSPKDMDDFVAGMKSIVRMPLESIMQMLCTINYILNGEKIELKDISILDSDQKRIEDLMEKHQTTRIMEEEFLENMQRTEQQNTFVLEQKMLRMVRKGDVISLKNWLSSAPAIRGGTLAPDQLRQVKNTFIVSVTLVSRAAIHGGMYVEDAFSLSDAFIQKCELMNSVDRITNLQYRMVLTFTERVEKLHSGSQNSKLAVDVSNYIQHHLSEAITTQAIADSMFLSRPYLSRKFKEETGESLTDIILKKKIEEAKRLLRYSDKSATAIGAYLGFSSLGHFSKAFKKCTGRTPTEYRENYAWSAST